jgi:probable F420-dependent oxidoreductase
MYVGLGLPTHRLDLGEEFCSLSAVTVLARCAEDAGFHEVFVTDHPAPPEKWLRGGGHHTLDPMVTLAVAASATASLRLRTNLYVAAYRNPFLTAKAVATLDLLSAGRVELGIGAGYLEGEFGAVGSDFARRNEVTDEAIVALKAIWSGQPVTMSGHGYEAVDVVSQPAPAQRPHPPIWIGGNSKRAIRRAVEHGTGWVPMPVPASAAAHLRTPALESVPDLAERIDYAQAHATAVGRKAPLLIAAMPAGLDMFSGAKPDVGQVLEEFEMLAALGVTHALVTLPAETRDELVDRIEWFGDAVVEGVGPL